MTFAIRNLTVSDWPVVRDIYQQGIETGDATYETQAPDFEALKAKFLAEPQVVAEDSGKIAGWAMLSGVSNRCVYAGVAEVSVYVASGYRGQGIGKALLAELIPLTEKLGYWTLQAQIFPENKASIAIHEQAGFRVIGYREKLGKREGIWRDVIFLERRSSEVGND